MRNFEERMEEIRRRSEKIIKERKKRRLFIAAVCIPAVLCVALVLPQVLSKDTMEPSIDSGAVNEDYQNPNRNRSYVEVSGNGMTITLSQPELVNQIVHVINSAAKPEMNVSEQPEFQDEVKDTYKDFLTDDREDVAISSEYSSASVYTVTVHTASGETRYYELMGNQLKSGDSQEVRILTAQELSDLRNLLGITQEEENK